MELTFTKDEHRNEVATYVAQGDFMLHIERDAPGKLSLYQNSSESGRYALFHQFVDGNGFDVLDFAVRVLVPPLSVKIVSSTHVTMCEARE